jgi:hypothetical protein
MENKRFNLYNINCINNLELSSRNNVPVLRATHSIPDKLIPFNFVLSSTADNDSYVHFFIDDYQYEVWCDILWDEDTDPEYMNQILEWKVDGNGYDDAPDSAASLRREGLKNNNYVLSDDVRAFFHGSG